MGYYACRHNDAVILNRYDLGGMLNVMARRIGTLRPDEIDERSYHAGAFNALYVLEAHEFRDQEEFFTLFDGLEPLKPKRGDAEYREGIRYGTMGYGG